MADREVPKIVETGLKAVDGHRYGIIEEALARDAAEMLNRHYPGYLWAVNVNSEGNVMIIKNYTVSIKYGYTLHLDKLDPTMKKVMLAGGEILERANLARGKDEGWNPKKIDGVLDKHQPIQMGDGKTIII
jgi:hypothetical protein